MRPCRLRGGIHAAKGPTTVGGQGPVALVCSVFNKQPADHRTWLSLFSKNHQPTVWCGVLAACGTVGGMDGHRALEPPSFESHRASNNATPRAIV
ncbi:hypothetical protein ACDI97_22020 [Xanthomonas axonopodis pv. fascicularis]|uniref:hypothetical protein n=1 Tax=Xanthomonas axonopodis TaxID=53413 RepID=UPI0035311810